MQRLAAWSYQYSSHVSLLPGHALVLEIGGSCRLFGSERSLLSRLETELRNLGYHARLGSAPTPEAARLAARHGLRIPREERIVEHIRRLPLASLQIEGVSISDLEKMGFRHLGEILRLPRKALGRRLGPAMVDYLDRLTGSRPDPLKAWQPPQRFFSAIELPGPVARSQALLFPLRRLVAELGGVLRARDHGVQTLDFAFRHENGIERLQLGLRQPARDEERILLLLRERMERLELPAPVHHIALSADRLLPFDAVQDTLFPDRTHSARGNMHALLERLQARLGQEAVHGLRGHEDHRPERSWAKRGIDEKADCQAMAHRPVWLFARPQRCRIEDFDLLAGPERIESGWWDGHDCRRDYFVVRDHCGRTLWAFREYKPRRGWFLQGLFA